MELEDGDPCLTKAALIAAKDPPAELGPGASFRGRFAVSYAPERRPFSYLKFRLGLRAPRSPELLAFEPVYVYFTPYDSVEVWSAEDFEGLKRVWCSPHDSSARRRAASKGAVPASDLTYSDLDDRRLQSRLVFASGFAYGVPRRIATSGAPRIDAKAPARLQPYALRREGMSTLDAGAALRKAPPAGGGAGLGSPPNQYAGSVTGSIFATVVPDFSDGPTALNIVGIRVELLSKQALGDEVIGTDFTGEGGVFDIAFDVSKDASAWTPTASSRTARSWMARRAASFRRRSTGPSCATPAPRRTAPAAIKR